MGVHLVRDEGVAGSNPATPPRIQEQNQDLYDRAENASALWAQLWAQVARPTAASASRHNPSTIQATTGGQCNFEINPMDHSRATRLQKLRQAPPCGARTRGGTHRACGHSRSGSN